MVDLNGKSNLRTPGIFETNCNKVSVARGHYVSFVLNKPKTVPKSSTYCHVQRSK